MVGLGPDHASRAGRPAGPVYVFYVGLGLSLLAGVIYVVTVRGRMRVEARGRRPA